MRVLTKIILTFVVLLIGMMGAGTWPYFPSWIGMKISLLFLVTSVYIVYQIWKKKPVNSNIDETDSSLNDKVN